MGIRYFFLWYPFHILQLEKSQTCTKSPCIYSRKGIWKGNLTQFFPSFLLEVQMNAGNTDATHA